MESEVEQFPAIPGGDEGLHAGGDPAGQHHPDLTRRSYDEALYSSSS